MRAAEASAKELGEALTIVNEVAYEAVSDADRELAYAEKWRDYSKSRGRGRGIKHRRCCEGTAVLLRSAKLRCAKFRHANYPAGQAEFARLDKQMRVIEERFVWLKKARTEVQANKDLDLGCDQADAAGQGVAVNLSCRQEEPKVLFQNSRALVIGQGSIGQRHARVLRENGAEVSTVSVAAPGAFRSLEEAFLVQRYSYVIVANETAKHIETIRDLASRGYQERLLVEKPLACHASEADGMSHLVGSFSRFGVGYNLRFNSAVFALRDALQDSSVVEARVHVGQYLPSWRPGTDYRNTSSGRLTAGGGALRDLSHEIDLIQHLFGPWSELVAAGGNLGALGIETDEAWSILFRMKSGSLITLTMNYYDRAPERFIAVTTRDGSSLRADLIDCELSMNGQSWNYPADRDATYRIQHTAMLNYDARSVCSFDEAAEVMKTIAAVETSAVERRWIAA